MPSMASLRKARRTSLAEGYSTSCTPRVEVAKLTREVERLAADPDMVPIRRAVSGGRMHERARCTSRYAPSTRWRMVGAARGAAGERRRMSSSQFPSGTKM